MGVEIDKFFRASYKPFVVLYDSRQQLLGPALEIPPAVDLSRFDSPVTAQSVGSCCADAATNLLENLMCQRDHKSVVDLSRLFLYWCARRYAHAQNMDAGTSLLLTIKVLAEIGVCTEEEMPYNIDSYNTPPNDAQTLSAAKYRIGAFYSIRNIDEMLSALAQNLPVAFAIVYMGISHAMLAVGYDREQRLLKCKNSWGPDYDEKGYTWIGFDGLEGMLEAYTFTLP